MHEFRVPFDITKPSGCRMSRSKQKSPGVSDVEGTGLCAASRYLSTARKQAVNVFAAIRDALTGEPWMPPAPTP